jgi:hypothetical protein
VRAVARNGALLRVLGHPIRGTRSNTRFLASVANIGHMRRA